MKYVCPLITGIEGCRNEEVHLRVLKRKCKNITEHREKVWEDKCVLRGGTSTKHPEFWERTDFYLDTSRNCSRYSGSRLLRYSSGKSAEVTVTLDRCYGSWTEFECYCQYPGTTFTTVVRVVDLSPLPFQNVIRVSVTLYVVCDIIGFKQKTTKIHYVCSTCINSFIGPNVIILIYMLRVLRNFYT